MAEKYLAVEEVAQVLSITNAEVIAATTQGQLRGFKDGSTWKFRKEDVDRYAEDLRSAVKAGDDFGYGDDYDLDENGSNVGGSSDINNTLDNDVSFSPEESGLALSDYTEEEGDELVLGEDNDLTGSSLGGSGLGLAEQSGISLMSATDSGISLDDDQSGEVLELGEDNLQIGSSLLSGSLAASLSVANDDFSLTTDDADEAGDEEDSGSQVIMIDENDDLGGMNASDGDELGDGLGETPVDGFDAGDASEPITQMVPQIIPMEMPEKPYSIWTVLGLLVCFLFLTTTLLFTVDLIRNIWSWDKTPYSSALMDWVINTFIDK